MSAVAPPDSARTPYVEERPSDGRGISKVALPSLPVLTVASYHSEMPHGSCGGVAVYTCGERTIETFTFTPAAGAPLRDARTCTGTPASGSHAPRHSDASESETPPAFASTCTGVPDVAPFTTAIAV